MAEDNRNKTQSVTKATRIQRFKEKSKGTLKVGFVFLSAIHVAKIVIAGVYFKECPTEPDIPKYLLILGILGVITKLVSLFKDFLMKYVRVSPVISIIMTAELTIFIIGSYYVYREFRPNYDPQSGDKYCNKTLYLFSFIYITITYCLILICVLLIGCFILTIVILDKKCEEKEVDDDNTTEVAVEVEQTDQKE